MKIEIETVNDYELLVVSASGKLYACVDQNKGIYRKLTLLEKLKLIL